MDINTIGIVIFLIGIVTLLQSFNLEATKQTTYLVVGIALVIGGLIYAKTK